jgi:hypothetical protein
MLDGGVVMGKQHFGNGENLMCANTARTNGLRACPPPDLGMAGLVSAALKPVPRIFLTLPLTMWSLASPAAEWSVTPKASATTVYDDNLRLDSGPHDSVFGAILELSAEMAVATEVSTVNLAPRVRLERYTEDHTGSGKDEREIDLDNEQFYLDFSGKHRIERTILQLRGNFTRDTTLTSEREPVDPSQGGTAVTGFIQDRKVRQSFDVNPSVAYEMSEKNTIQVGAGYRDVSYSDAENTGLADFTYKSANLSDTHMLTEYDQLMGSVFVSQQESEGFPEIDRQLISLNPLIIAELSQTSTQTDSLGGQLQYTHWFSDTLKGSIGAGVITSDMEIVQNFLDAARNPIANPRIDEDSDTGFLFNASAEKKFEQTTVTGSFARSVNPSGFGGQNSQDDLFLSALHQISPRLDGGLNFRYLRTEAQSKAFNNLQNQSGRNLSRDYLSINTRLAYRLTEFWSLSAAYTYSSQDVDTQPEAISADSNGLLFSINYDGQKRAIAR